MVVPVRPRLALPAGKLNWATGDPGNNRSGVRGQTFYTQIVYCTVLVILYYSYLHCKPLTVDTTLETVILRPSRLGCGQVEFLNSPDLLV